MAHAFWILSKRSLLTPSLTESHWYFPPVNWWHQVTNQDPLRVDVCVSWRTYTSLTQTLFHISAHVDPFLSTNSWRNCSFSLDWLKLTCVTLVGWRRECISFLFRWPQACFRASTRLFSLGLACATFWSLVCDAFRLFFFKIAFGILSHFCLHMNFVIIFFFLDLRRMLRYFNDIISNLLLPSVVEWY